MANNVAPELEIGTRTIAVRSVRNQEKGARAGSVVSRVMMKAKGMVNKSCKPEDIYTYPRFGLQRSFSSSRPDASHATPSTIPFFR